MTCSCSLVVAAAALRRRGLLSSLRQVRRRRWRKPVSKSKQEQAARALTAPSGRDYGITGLAAPSANGRRITILGNSALPRAVARLRCVVMGCRGMHCPDWIVMATVQSCQVFSLLFAPSACRYRGAVVYAPLTVQRPVISRAVEHACCRAHRAQPAAACSPPGPSVSCHRCRLAPRERTNF